MDHCQECGETAAKHDLIPTDIGTIHRGACHQRFTLALENVDMTCRLWAALSLYDMNQPPLVKVLIQSKGPAKSKITVLGVIVDHLTETDVWVIESETGALFDFTEAFSLKVAEDAYAA